MRAVIVEHRNELGAIRDVPTPGAGPAPTARSRQRRRSDPVDWKQRDSYNHSLPFTLGQDFAGMVSAVGDRVTKYKAEDRVFGIARDHGAYAEFTIVPEDDRMQPIAKIPDDVGDADAAALPTAGLTALACVERIGLRENHVLFIVGVTGAVGQFAAQIARGRGIRVSGSGSAANAGVAKSLGLDRFVAYDRENVHDVLRQAFPNGVDALLDLADDATHVNALVDTVRRDGVLATTIHNIDEDYAREHGVRGMNINLFESPQSSHEGLRNIVELLERGDLRVPIAAEYNLTDAVQALELQKSGKVTGKVLITV